MRSSYRDEDVTLLLKDITGMVQPQPTEEREKLIQAGKHYSEMLPVEYVPTEKYMQVYREALKNYAKPVALAVGRLADKIVEKKGQDIVLVSLARAGIPIGILVKRYIAKKYPNSKSDLFAVFMEKCGSLTAKDRYTAMITMHSWMFLSSFEKLRKWILWFLKKSKSEK